MKKNKFEIDKFSKTIIIVFLIYSIIMIAIFLPAYLKRQGNLYIVTNSIRIKYVNGTWSNIDKDNDYKLKQFNIYQDNEYLGKYEVLYANNLLSLYEKGKSISYSGNIFGYRGNIKLDIYGTDSIDKLSDTDKVFVREALTELKLNNTNLSYIEKKEIDVNNNGILDTIYCISNFYNEDDNPQRFSIIFMVKDGKVKIIDKIIVDSSEIDDCRILSIMNILDIKKDKKMELLYTNNYSNGSADSECAAIYDLSNNKLIHNFCE